MRSRPCGVWAHSTLEASLCAVKAGAAGVGSADFVLPMLKTTAEPLLSSQ